MMPIHDLLDGGDGRGLRRPRPPPVSPAARSAPPAMMKPMPLMKSAALTTNSQLVSRISASYFATMLKLRRPMGSPSRVAVTVTFHVPDIDSCPMP